MQWHILINKCVDYLVPTILGYRSTTFQHFLNELKGWQKISPGGAEFPMGIHKYLFFPLKAKWQWLSFSDPPPQKKTKQKRVLPVLGKFGPASDRGSFLFCTVEVELTIGISTTNKFNTH
jgi:hypothetical protein